MNEFKTAEVSEVRNIGSEKFKEIKPESGMTPEKARGEWDKEFSKESLEEAKDGGSYREVKANSDSEKKEVNHMPADSISPLERNDGPAIKMDREDHCKTASWGSSLEARAYRAEQREKIDNGDFRGAIQMDIDDIKEKFGDKYDKAIDQMLQYVDKLETEGRI